MCLWCGDADFDKLSGLWRQSRKRLERVRASTLVSSVVCSNSHPGGSSCLKRCLQPYSTYCALIFEVGQVVESLPMATLKYTRQQQQQEQAVPSVEPISFVENAQIIFSKYDVDNSGGIDLDELEMMLHELLDTSDRDVPIHTHAKNAIDQYSSDGLVLSFSDFLRAVSVRPLLQLIPKSVRDEALMAAAEIRSGATVSEQVMPQLRSPGKQAFTLARSLFGRFDADGGTQCTLASEHVVGRQQIPG